MYNMGNRRKPMNSLLCCPFNGSIRRFFGVLILILFLN